MPDWRRLVGRRLGHAAISARRRDEIGREMAGFLEDSYEERVSRGEKPRAAARGAIAGAGRWSDVIRELERVEGFMTSRLKSLWLPGVVVSIAAVALLMGFARIPGSMKIVRFGPQAPILFFNWPWLLSLPLLGAAGAEWSRRQRGGRFERLSVALFPGFVMMVLWLLLISLGGLPDAHLAPMLRLAKLSVMLLNWVLLPAAALLLGGLPVLWRMKS